MYAIVKAAGKQYRVSQDDVVRVDKLAASAGDEVVLDEVMLVSSDNGVSVGTPYVSGAAVVGKVIGHEKGDKIRAFNYKPKKNVRKHWGHRQQYTSLAIKEIRLP